MPLFSKEPDQKNPFFLKKIGVSIIPACWSTKKQTSDQPLWYKKRQKMFFFFFCISFFLVFFIRTASLQIFQGRMFQEQAENNRLREERENPTRGIILDRFGEVLVKNNSAFTLFISPKDLPKEEETRRVLLADVAKRTHKQIAELDLLLQGTKKEQEEPLIVDTHLSYEIFLDFLVQAENYPGFFVEKISQRNYLSSVPSLSHILGYVGRISEEEYQLKKEDDYRRTDEIGKAGLEYSAEKALRGIPGINKIEVNALGEEVAFLSQEPPQDGQNITTTIDLAFQTFIEQQLQETLQETQISKASVVAIDPHSGEVYALVSFPTFDSNLFAARIDEEQYQQLLKNPDQPLFFRAISGSYPSGSIFKPFVATAALAEGIIQEQTTFLSTGGISLSSWFFPDWKAGGHGPTNLFKAIAESVNTFFYIIGGGYEQVTGLGVDRITQYAALFGFGSPTGIDLPAEANGFLPSKAWKEETKKERWYVGDTYHLAIGQGDFLTTPLQMATAVSVLANGGTFFVPHLIKKIGENIQEEQSRELPESVKKVIPLVQKAMRQTVTQGSARFLSDLSQPIAGKTGTAQLGTNQKPHAWFTAFGPFEHPDLVLVVLLENGGEGSTVAVPLAKKIFSWWFEHRSNIPLVDPL